ncbi:MAG: fasciclin domain-containing protein, partial [Raineya sp.]
FAPNNQAFGAVNLSSLSDSAVRNILRYHIFQTENFRFSKQVTSGPNEMSSVLPNNLVWLNVPRVGEVYVNGTPVLRADIPATNAVIHEIGAVLVPPTKTMYQIIAETPSLSRFRQMANTRPDLASPNQAFIAGAVSLRQTLKSTRFQGTTTAAGTASTIFAGQNLTIFVPNDAAFDAVGLTDSTAAASFINSVSGQRIVNHHLSGVSGRLFAKGLTPGGLPTFVAGRPVNILLEGGGVVINRKSLVGGVELPGDPIDLANGFNNANVVTADILATNGVIHIINRPLKPEN